MVEFLIISSFNTYPYYNGGNDHYEYSKTNRNTARGYAHIKSKKTDLSLTRSEQSERKPRDGSFYTKKDYSQVENVTKSFIILGDQALPPINATIDSAILKAPEFNHLKPIYNIKTHFQPCGVFPCPNFNWSVKDPIIYSATLTSNINRLIINGSSFCTNKNWITCNIYGYNTPSSPPIIEFTNHTGLVLDISSLSNEFKYAGLKLLTLTINDPHSNVSRSTTSNMPIEPIITKTTTTSSDLGGPVTISGDLFDSVNSFGFKTIKTIQIGSQSCLNVVDLSVYSNSFICQLGPISKMSNNQQFTNIPILVTIEGATSNNSTILFNYDVPSISNIYQNGSKIYFEGELLGYSSQISKTWISVSNSTMINNSFVPTQIDIESLPLVSNRSSVNRKWIVQFRIPNNFKSGLFNFFISNHNNQLISNSVQLSIKADIGEISTPQTKGDTLTIFDALFGNPISIKFTNRPDIKNTSNPMLIDSSTIIVNISWICVTPISRHGGVITISGSNYDVNNTSVFIFNTIGCNTTTIVNDTTIYCQVKLNGSDTLKFGENLNVTIIVNTQIVISSTLNITSITGGQETNILRIIQFTDLHYGENIKYDKLNYEAQNKLLDYEKPDFVMLSGDMISGYNKNFYRDQSKYHTIWDILTKPMRDRNIPWAITFGNHDAEGPYSSSQIVDLDMSFNGSLTRHGQIKNGGETNYVIPIYSSNSSVDIASLIYIFDSDNFGCGDSGDWGCIYKHQVDWYEETSDHYNKTPSIAYVHIPPVEVIDLWNNFEVYGDFGDSASCCYHTKESKFIEKMIKRGDIRALYFGHDHRNDYHGDYYGIDLGYGRKTGYGSYDPKYAQGARVLEIQQDPFKFVTWIRDVHGTIDIQTLHTPSVKLPRHCCIIGESSFKSDWISYLLVLSGVMIGVFIFQLAKVSKIKNIDK
ncbi:hypothetical protein PPL_01894 [Heterostelium album PN500]|uniref:Calcineurin-like phosphoesterase domain-containing protein n=1 Tax=Heterostelium pallidum (strain ATCC 26659 / Pp 5 / PN500) TaxID=670386 RepID=D3B0S7_HETP5|nr:hypothetical protein PPL_01894 [Heterostelium album PN500]EFA84901.1 hypothetical protein PPL_01894 [Heterostelium album PN500]|eukprot:XP_020437011.1 hypothetical protein PPL_01894 [Heterostelium album PN500]